MFQAAAEAAPFNGGVDYRKATAAAVYDPATMPAPGSRVRGPSSGRRPSDEGGRHGGGGASARALDPEAELDWAGNPVPKSSKAHVPKPAETLSAALTPRSEMASHVELRHYERDIRFQSVDPDAAGNPLGVATYQFGPGGEHTASVWKTEAQRLFEQEATDAASRSERSSKKILTAPYDGGRVGSAEAAIARARQMHEGVATGVSMAAFATGGGGAGGRDTAGSKPPRAMHGSGSLLAGIGAKIAVSMASAPSGSGSSASASSCGGGIGGAAGGEDGGRRLSGSSAGVPTPSSKDLFVENYRAAPLGYTGRVGRPRG